MYTIAVKNYKGGMYEEKCKESRKERTESHLEYPQAIAQSYKVLEKSSCTCESVRSKFSKVRPFRSCHKVQRRQRGTMFQILEWTFPKPLYQPKKRSRTQPGSTHMMPNFRNTKLHSPTAWSQWIRRWLMVSPSWRHMQHHPAITDGKHCKIQLHYAFEKQFIGSVPVQLITH